MNSAIFVLAAILIAFAVAIGFWVRWSMRTACQTCFFPLHRCECPKNVSNPFMQELGEVREFEAIQGDIHTAEKKRRKLRETDETA